MAKRILITPGELTSVGLEVTLKALASPQLPSGKAYVFYANPKQLSDHDYLFKNIQFKIIKNLEDASSPGLFCLESASNPVEWYKEACLLCEQDPKKNAVVTGPLKKSSFSHAKTLGHTDYLRLVYPSKKIFMTFLGEHYNCLLLNDHIPLRDVAKSINYEHVQAAITQINTFFPNAKIALLGLNPHAGEEGLLGSEELEVHLKICENNSNVEGPLPSDGFFNLEKYRSYDFIIANYHDQGLIPFKLIHGFNASQASLGAPFVRTSVDHGTADDLYLKNLADGTSMLKAIELASQLLDRME